MFGNVWQCLACAMLRGHTCYGHNSSPSSEDRIIREEVVNRDVKRMSLHAQQHHAQWPFKVQESGPNMHIGRLHDYILSQLILSFKSLKIKKKKQATQVGTVPSPQSILDAYQQGADPNTMVSAAGP